MFPVIQVPDTPPDTQGIQVEGGGEELPGGVPPSLLTAHKSPSGRTSFPLSPLSSFHEIEPVSVGDGAGGSEGSAGVEGVRGGGEDREGGGTCWGWVGEGEAPSARLPVSPPQMVPAAAVTLGMAEEEEEVSGRESVTGGGEIGAGEWSVTHSLGVHCSCQIRTLYNPLW